MGTTALGIEFV